MNSDETGPHDEISSHYIFFRAEPCVPNARASTEGEFGRNARAAGLQEETGGRTKEGYRAVADGVLVEYFGLAAEAHNHNPASGI